MIESYPYTKNANVIFFPCRHMRYGLPNHVGCPAYHNRQKDTTTVGVNRYTMESVCLRYLCIGASRGARRAGLAASDDSMGL